MHRKRFTSTELAALVLGTVVFAGGFLFLLFPQEGIVVRPTNDASGWTSSMIEVVSNTEWRIYGFIAMLVGCGVAALALYRPES